MARETLQITLDASKLKADIEAFASAVALIRAGDDLSLSPEARDFALSFADELLDGSSRIVDRLRLKSEPGSATGAGDLVCSVEFGPLFDEVLVAVRARDLELRHDVSPE